MASDKRVVNAPELVAPGDLWQDCVWDVWGQVYPTVLAVQLEVTGIPDPFDGPTTERKAYHCYVDLHGLARVDLGWSVGGEAHPHPPVVDVVLDTVWTAGLRDGYGATRRPEWVRGKGQLETGWELLLLMTRITAIGLAVAVVESAKPHVAYAGFWEQSRDGIYFANGMLRRWDALSTLDLGTLEFVD